MDHGTRRAKAQFLCRRGMLEIDILLKKFMELEYDNLSLAQQEIFLQILECQDPDIFSWILGFAKPDNVEFGYLLGKIRDMSARATELS